MSADLSTIAPNVVCGQSPTSPRTPTMLDMSGDGVNRRPSSGFTKWARPRSKELQPRREVLRGFGVSTRIAVKRDDVPILKLGGQRRMLAGWPSQPARTARCQGPLCRVMCSEICIHSDPLLAGLCIGTRTCTGQGPLFPSLTDSSKIALLRRRTQSRGPSVAICLTTCSCAAPAQRLRTSSEGVHKWIYPSRSRKDGPDQRRQTVVWQRCIGGPGSWPGSSEERASRFGDVEWAVSGANHGCAWKHWPPAPERASFKPL